MKLHDLRPADGSHRRRTRVGRGIAAGKGKTAGRGTKGQRSRTGGSIPPWFEGGQTPLHMRIPKLRGFRSPFKVEYEVVNVGRIAALVAAGRLESGEIPGGTSKTKGRAAPLTVNQEILRATGLVSSLTKPLKVLGGGDLDVPLFVVADAFTASARSKIEAAGGTVQVLELPGRPSKAIGAGPEAEPEPPEVAAKAEAPAAAVEAVADAQAEPTPVEEGPKRSKRAGRAKPADEGAPSAETPSAAETPSDDATAEAAVGTDEAAQASAAPRKRGRKATAETTEPETPSATEVAADQAETAADDT
jgi:large subunit ribosomal protein L15